MSIRSLVYGLCGPAELLIMSLLSGCTHSSDPFLALADAKMEEHPDSALMILEKIDTQKLVRNEDKVRYTVHAKVVWLISALFCWFNHVQ